MKQLANVIAEGILSNGLDIDLFGSYEFVNRNLNNIVNDYLTSIIEQQSKGNMSVGSQFRAAKKHYEFFIELDKNGDRYVTNWNKVHIQWKYSAFISDLNVYSETGLQYVNQIAELNRVIRNNSKFDIKTYEQTLHTTRGERDRIRLDITLR